MYLSTHTFHTHSIHTWTHTHTQTHTHITHTHSTRTHTHHTHTQHTHTQHTYCCCMIALCKEEKMFTLDVVPTSHLMRVDVFNLLFLFFNSDCLMLVEHRFMAHTPNGVRMGALFKPRFFCNYIHIHTRTHTHTHTNGWIKPTNTTSHTSQCISYTHIHTHTYTHTHITHHTSHITQHTAHSTHTLFRLLASTQIREPTL